MDSLSEAKKLASKIRFSEDQATPGPFSPDYVDGEKHKDRMLKHGVLISHSVTPALEENIVEVCSTLGLPRSCVSAFVFNSPEIQADCLVNSPTSCIVRFSSGLINLMDAKELMFVIGHEISHFLLEHGAYRGNLLSDTPESFMICRAQELSADRLGFLAVNDINIAARAIIKTASGLSDEFLRFDVSAFLNQAELIANQKVGDEMNTSHPSMLIRCRSLLWFSSSVSSLVDVSNLDRTKLLALDQKISSDLHKFVDGHSRLKKENLTQEILHWKTLLLVFYEGSFTNRLQEEVSSKLGKETVDRYINFLDLYPANELENEINSRLSASVASLFSMFPNSAQEIEDECFSKAYELVKV